MRYKESKRTKEFQIDKQAEDTLLQINDSLESLNLKLSSSSSQINVPLIFFCCAPRSGSTVISQYLARSNQFHYVSNFMARFWKAPYLGGLIEKEIGIREKKITADYTSIFGRTELPSDPHEFGFFWNNWLKPNTTTTLNKDEIKNVDGLGLQNQINAIASLYDKPLFFKSGIAGMNPELLHRLFPNAYFITIKRKYEFIAQSLLSTRKKFLGSKKEWWSIKPLNYENLKNLDPSQQVAGQVVEIYKDIDNQLTKIPVKQKLEIHYEDFCANPHLFLKKIMTFVGEKLSEHSELNESSIKLNNKITIDKVEFEKIKNAFEQFESN